MSNLFDMFSKQFDMNALKRTASEALSGLGSAGGSLRQSVGQNGLGMLGAGALGGLLGTLLGGSSKKMGGTALKLGSAAALGGLAWTFYKKWQQGQGRQPADAAQGSAYGGGWQQTPLAAGSSPEMAVDPTARLLLRAMVYSARADGHIDDQERTRINAAVGQMFPEQDMSGLLGQLMTEPVDPAALASEVSSAEQAEDLFRLSCVIMDPDVFMEKSYLDGLAQALAVPPTLREQIENEAAQIRQSISA